jgi:hypothetical protein
MHFILKLKAGLLMLFSAVLLAVSFISPVENSVLVVPVAMIALVTGGALFEVDRRLVLIEKNKFVEEKSE